MKKIFTSIITICLGLNLCSQNSSNVTGTTASTSSRIASYVDSFSHGFIYLHSIIQPDSFFSREKSLYAIGSHDQFRKLVQKTDKAGNIHQSYQQYHKNLAVHSMQINFHTYSSKMMVNGNMVQGLNLDTNNKITRASAISIAKSQFPHARILDNRAYSGHLYNPNHAELLIYTDKQLDYYTPSDFALAYRVNVAFDSPSYEYYSVYIHAVTGQVIRKATNLRSNTANTCTHIYGTQAIPVQRDSVLYTHFGGRPSIFDSLNFCSLDVQQVYHPFKISRYHSFDTSLGTGLLSYCGVGSSMWSTAITYSSITSPAHSINLTDFHCSDTFSGMRYVNQVHWIGSEFLKMIQSKFSYRLSSEMDSSFAINCTSSGTFDRSTDQRTLQLVVSNYISAKDNATWDSSRHAALFYMHDTVGGNPESWINHCDYVATMDVVGHELGHMLQHDMGRELDYFAESGALNESYGDVMGYITERHLTLNFSTGHALDWTHGEDIGYNKSAPFPSLKYQRSLSDPESKGQPSIYGGQYWFDTRCCIGGNDFCGVHTNSGVHNHWYYLMAVGGTKTHNGKSYTVTPIGYDTLENLFFQTFMYMLTPFSKYRDARAAYLASVDILYAGDTHLKSKIAHAWDAVNVMDSISMIDFEYHVRDYANPSTKTLIWDHVKNLKFAKKLIVDSGYTLIVRNASVLEFGTASSIEIHNKASMSISKSTLQAIRHHDSCRPEGLWLGIKVFPFDSAHKYFNPAITGTVINDALIVDSSNINNATMAIFSGYCQRLPTGKNLNISSRHITVTKSKFIDNVECIRFTTEFMRGGKLKCQNNLFEHTDTSVIIFAPVTIDIRYYQTNLARPFPFVSNNQIQLSHNTFKSIPMHRYNRSPRAIFIDVSDFGTNWVGGVCEDTIRITHSKFENYDYGIGAYRSKRYVLTHDTFINVNFASRFYHYTSLTLTHSVFEACGVGALCHIYGIPGVTTIVPEKSVISDNTFTGVVNNSSKGWPLTASAIYLIMAQNVDVRNNVINNPYINAGDSVVGYRGIDMSSKNVKVIDNAFNTKYSGYNSKPATAIYAGHNGTDDNYISRNAISDGWHAGIWVTTENRGLRIRCNTIGQNSPPAYAGLIVQGNLKDQGLPDGVDLAQRCQSHYYPAANTYNWLHDLSLPCTNHSAEAILVDTAFSKFKFLYNTHEKDIMDDDASYPQCVSPTYNQTKWDYKYCPNGSPGHRILANTCADSNVVRPIIPPGEGCTSAMVFKDTVLQRIARLRLDVATVSSTYSDFIDYTRLQRDYHEVSSLSQTAKYTIRQRCENDSAIPRLRTYLKASDLWEDKVELVSNYVDAKEYSMALQEMSELDSTYLENAVYSQTNTKSYILEDKEDLKYYFQREITKNIAIEQNDIDYHFSESELNQLLTIQSKQRLAGYYVEAMLSLYLDTVFLHSSPQIQFNSADTVPDMDWQSLDNEFPLLIYPNPTEGNIRFEFISPEPIQSSSYILVFKTDNPSQNPMTDYFTEMEFSRKYDLSSRQNGVYTIAIRINGTWVAAKQFIIHH